jgi:hypothetical protein
VIYKLPDTIAGYRTIPERTETMTFRVSTDYDVATLRTRLAVSYSGDNVFLKRELLIDDEVFTVEETAQLAKLLAKFIAKSRGGNVAV